MAIKNHSGKRFGKLLVTEVMKLVGGKAAWLCKCDCGNEKFIRANSLVSNMTKSCGCLHKETMAANSIYKGLRSHKLYSVRRGMLNRCHLPSTKHYDNYGGRGISVCEEWRNSYLAFFNWALKSGWEDGLTIDRINNDGNYEPSNCRWVSRKANQNNRRNSTFVIINGQKKAMDELEHNYGIPASRIAHRIKYNKWSVEKAILTPVGSRTIHPLEAIKKGYSISKHKKEA